MMTVQANAAGLADAFAEVEQKDIFVARMHVSPAIYAWISQEEIVYEGLSQPNSLSHYSGEKPIGHLWGAEVFLDSSLDADVMCLYSEYKNLAWQFSLA